MEIITLFTFILGEIINIRIIFSINIHSVSGRLIGGVIVNHFIGQIARMSRITKNKIEKNKNEKRNYIELQYGKCSQFPL